MSFGGRIYGFNVGKKCELTINPKEAKVVVKIFELYAKGYSLKDIQEYCDKNAISFKTSESFETCSDI